MDFKKFKYPFFALKQQTAKTFRISQTLRNFESFCSIQICAALSPSKVFFYAKLTKCIQELAIFSLFFSFIVHRDFFYSSIFSYLHKFIFEMNEVIFLKSSYFLQSVHFCVIAWLRLIKWIHLHKTRHELHMKVHSSRRSFF